MLHYPKLIRYVIAAMAMVVDLVSGFFLKAHAETMTNHPTFSNQSTMIGARIGSVSVEGQRIHKVAMGNIGEAGGGQRGIGQAGG